MDLDSIFNEASKNYIEPERELSFSDRLIKEIENDFKGIKSIENVRTDEKKVLLNNLSKYENLLRKLNKQKRNIKISNSSRRQRVMEEIRNKKIDLQNKINQTKLHLDDLAIECGEDEGIKKAKAQFQNKDSEPYKSSGMTPYDQDFF